LTVARPGRAPPSPAIKLDEPTRTTLAGLLVERLKDAHGLALGEFDGLELLDYVVETLGPYLYNQGLYDAQAVLQGRMESIVEAIAEIEKPTKRR
jgi:uncharacterized protein (DUF2164 family)